MGRPSSVFTAKGELVYDDRSGDAPSFASLAKDHPSVRKAGITRESARLAVRSAQLSNSPAIYGTGSYGRQGSALSSMKDRWSVGISASVSLFEGGASYYGVKKAAAQLRQAESDEASTRSAAAVSIEKAWNALRDSVADAAVKEEYLRAETEREKIAEAQYSIGRMTFDDWTVIESGYVKAKQSLLSSQAAVLTAEAAWIQSIGGPLEHETQK
jgi:outer membrane protein TolC